MKKVFVTGIVLVVFIFYAVHHKASSGVSQATPPSSKNESNQSSIETHGSFKDGTYTGSAADAFYGTVQVKVVIQNGKITDVQFLQYPNDQSESVQVSQGAMPILKQEAIQAQSAKVDIVSGATQTSQAFAQSLASALTQAQ